MDESIHKVFQHFLLTWRVTLHKALYHLNHKQTIKGFLQNSSENFGKKCNVAQNPGKMFKKCKEFLSNLAAGLSLAIILKM